MNCRAERPPQSHPHLSPNVQRIKQQLGQDFLDQPTMILLPITPPKSADVSANA